MVGRTSRVTETATRFQDDRFGKLQFFDRTRTSSSETSTWTACLKQDRLIIVFFPLISKKKSSYISVDLYSIKFVEDAALV